MPDNNNRTTNEWLQTIHSENERAHFEILARLEGKVDQEACNRREDRLTKLEDKHSNLALKVAGIAGGISTVIGLAGWIIGG